MKKVRDGKIGSLIVARMGRVIFMCGPAGSGKSTVARQFEREGMARLSFDQEAWSRGITTMPLPEDVRRDIEQALRARLTDLVRAGSDVVLDFSFWSRKMREEYRELLRPLGVVPETVYLATDRATVLQRINARAAAGGDDFKLSPELAATYFDHFEVPTPEEGPLTVLCSLGSADCFVCRKHQERGALLPGGPVAEDDLVLVSHVVPPDVLGGEGTTAYLGHLFVEPHRHAPGLGDLTDAEARAIGSWSTRASRALRDVAGAEHVYAAVFGDGVPHLHVHLLPRFPGTPREYWGVHVNRWPEANRGTAAEIAHLVHQLRDYLAG